MIRIACAIYTRKSSDEGLEQEFNSLDAQREACEAYVLSQKHAGWKLLPDLYDDGGLSGGTMERPALKRLLDDIRAGKVHIVVVYKVDRLTRSLADFAKIVDVLDIANASFVSVTQQFNTTTSMGRLTLNMLLSFAQFEREIAGERIRDKIAASKAKGMWMGGTVPLGYDVEDKKLIVNPVEADTVRTIFACYAELGCARLLRDELDRRGIVSKRREGARGTLSGGKPFSRGALYALLQNRLYRGEIPHNGNVYPGLHEAIVDAELWERVQTKLAGNRQSRRLGETAVEPSLLAGLAVDARGQRMTPTHAVKRGRRYRYYVSAPLIQGGRSSDAQGWRVPAGELEGIVLERLRALFASGQELSEGLAPLKLEATAHRIALSRSEHLAESWNEMPMLEKRSLLISIVEQVRVAECQVALLLRPAGIASAVGSEAAASKCNGCKPSETFEVSVDIKLRRAGKGVRLVIGDVVAHVLTRSLVQLLGDAHAARDALLSGRDATIDAMTERLNLRKGYISSLLRLTYLAPDIIEAMVSGRHPEGLTPTKLLTASKDLPREWNAQREALGFAGFRRQILQKKL